MTAIWLILYYQIHFVPSQLILTHQILYGFKKLENCEAENNNNYGIQITAGQEYIEGQFLEKLNTTTKGHLHC